LRDPAEIFSTPEIFWTPNFLDTHQGRKISARTFGEIFWTPIKRNFLGNFLDTHQGRKISARTFGTCIILGSLSCLSRSAAGNGQIALVC